jgi:uncharacterized protein YndB with AHSA1/START domain
MAFNEYRFLTRWDVAAPREEVFAVLTDSKSLTRWWPSVYRAVDQLSPPTRPDGVGKRLGLHTQGWLPYRLHWQLHVVEHEPPVRLAFEASGDFVGQGVWRLHDRGDTTQVEYEWSIRADKPLLRRFSFVLKPVFAMNHRWAMARGWESLHLELERRRGRSVGPPPRPVSALWSGFVIVGLLATCAAALILAVG